MGTAIAVGQIWEGQQRDHPWRVRILKVMATTVFVEVVTGGSNHGRKTTLRIGHLRVAYRRVR